MKSTGSLARTPAWISAGIAALMTAGYLALIATEGDNAFWEVFPWAALMLVGVAAAATAAMAPAPETQRMFEISAAVVLGLVGLVSMFSVGLGFLIAAVVAGIAAARTEPATSSS